MVVSTRLTYHIFPPILQIPINKFGLLAFSFDSYLIPYYCLCHFDSLMSLMLEYSCTDSPARA